MGGMRPSRARDMLQVWVLEKLGDPNPWGDGTAEDRLGVQIREDIVRLRKEMDDVDRPSLYGYLNGTVVPHFNRKVVYEGLCGIPLDAWPRHHFNRLDARLSLRNTQIGHLFVREVLPRTEWRSRSVWWECECACGARVARKSSELRYAQKIHRMVRCSVRCRAQQIAS